MKIIFPLFFVFFQYYAHGQLNSDRPGAVAIDAFGINGNLVPTFLDSRPGDSFFSQDHTIAFETRSDFTSTFDLGSKKRNSHNFNDLTLTLVNRSSARSSVVVSAVKQGEWTNYLIGLDSWGFREVDINSILSADALYFFSIQDFEGILDVVDTESRSYTFSFEAIPPEASRNIGTLCSSYCEFFLRVAVDTLPNEYVDAWFIRYKDSPITTQCLHWTDPPRFFLDIHWPTKNTLHHDGSAHSEASCVDYNKCAKVQYATTSVANGNLLVWENYNYVFNIPGTGGTIQESFDDVLFSSTCGVARCNRPYGNICAADPGFMWFIYPPGGTPCPGHN